MTIEDVEALVDQLDATLRAKEVADEWRSSMRERRAARAAYEEQLELLRGLIELVQKGH